MSDLFAHARRADPETSHHAADAVTPDLRQLQARVADYARRQGAAGFMDAQMSADLDDTSSTLRTRRSELAARNIIIDSGQRRKWQDSPRLRIVWVHRDFVADPPPIVEPTPPASASDRLEAKALGNSLVSIAAGFRRQGFGAAAEQIERGGKMLQRFGA